MLNALWSAEFFVPPAGTAIFGSGVAVLNNGTIRGGDSTYYYTGTYQINNGVFTADVSIVHYSGPLNNVLGTEIKKIHVTLTGTPDAHEFEASGISKENQQPITVRLERLTGL